MKCTANNIHVKDKNRDLLQSVTRIIFKVYAVSPNNLTWSIIHKFRNQNFAENTSTLSRRTANRGNKRKSEEKVIIGANLTFGRATFGSVVEKKKETVSRII